MIAMTTKSSIRVKPGLFDNCMRKVSEVAVLIAQLRTQGPQLIGVRGPLVASRGEFHLVRFDEHNVAYEISAFDLEEFGEAAFESQDYSGIKVAKCGLGAAAACPTRLWTGWVSSVTE